MAGASGMSSKGGPTKAKARVAAAPLVTAKPIVQHGQMQVRPKADGTFGLYHAASGREISGGLTKDYAKQLASHFGRGAGVDQMRKATMGDATAKSFVDGWLAEGRRRSAPKLARGR